MYAQWQPEHLTIAFMKEPTCAGCARRMSLKRIKPHHSIPAAENWCFECRCGQIVTKAVPMSEPN
jgi:hypothetical protein